MKKKTVFVIFHSPFEECPVGCSASTHYEWTYTFAACSYEHHAVLLMEHLCHIVKEIEGQAIDMLQLVFPYKNEVRTALSLGMSLPVHLSGKSILMFDSIV